jgi:anti-sigma factor RsiW
LAKGYTHQSRGRQVPAGLLMTVSAELLSLYVDGQLSAEEAEAVEEAVRRDPALASQLEEFKMLEELFGRGEPEEVPDELRERLYGLGRVTPLARFEAVETAPVARRSWLNWAVAAAALVLVAFGIRALAHKPEVVLKDFSRMTLDAASGRALDTRTSKEVTVRAGDTLKAGPHERLSFRTLAGDLVVLLPGGALEVGDPRDGEIFELGRGTVLCTVLRREEPRKVEAGGYTVHVRREAHFGVRLEGAAVKAAGVGGRAARVTVAVSLGSVEVGRNGDRQEVKAYQRVTLQPGVAAQATHAAADPMYRDLMHAFRRHSAELIPGYFSGESGVVSVRRDRWVEEEGAHTLALTSGGREAAHATHLVLHVRASRPGPLLLTKVRPIGKGRAEAVTVRTAPVGKDWTVIAVPRAAFRDPAAERKERRISVWFEKLVRLELRPTEPGVKIDIKASLWAGRPPTEVAEVVR